MNHLVEEFEKNWEICQKFKNHSAPKIPLKNLCFTDKPFEQVFVDLTVYPEFNDFRYLLTMQDFFTRFVFIKALKTKEADQVAHAVIEILTQFNIFSSILSDRVRI